MTRPLAMQSEVTRGRRAIPFLCGWKSLRAASGWVRYAVGSHERVNALAMRPNVTRYAVLSHSEPRVDDLVLRS